MNTDVVIVHALPSHSNTQTAQAPLLEAHPPCDPTKKLEQMWTQNLSENSCKLDI